MKKWDKQKIVAYIAAPFIILMLLLLPVIAFVILSMVSDKPLDACTGTYSERLDNDIPDCAYEKKYKEEMHAEYSE